MRIFNRRIDHSDNNRLFSGLQSECMMQEFPYVTSPSLDPSTDDSYDDLQNKIAEMIRDLSDDTWYREAKHHLAELEKALTEKDVDVDEPLKLTDAVCLTELGGRFTADPESRVPSETITVRTLRTAIDSGQLAVIRPNSKNLYVTRRTIAAWLEKCHVQKNPPASSYVNHDTTKTANSLTKPSTSSKMTENNTQLDAARMILAELKNSSTSISSKNTRKT